MINILYRSITLMTLTLAGAIYICGQQSQPDLSMRTALYFTGAKTDSIDLAKDKYVVKDATMQLTKAQGSGCDDSGCMFNIGFIATRTGTTGVLSTYGLFTVESVGLTGNTVYFGAGVNVKQGVHSLKLKMGMNKVTFTIDPYQKTAETDENNNTFSANFKVVGTSVPQIKRVIPKN